MRNHHEQVYLGSQKQHDRLVKLHPNGRYVAMVHLSCAPSELRGQSTSQHSESFTTGQPTAGEMWLRNEVIISGIGSEQNIKSKQSKYLVVSLHNRRSTMWRSFLASSCQVLKFQGFLRNNPLITFAVANNLHDNSHLFITTISSCLLLDTFCFSWETR